MGWSVRGVRWRFKLHFGTKTETVRAGIMTCSRPSTPCPVLAPCPVLLYSYPTVGGAQLSVFGKNTEKNAEKITEYSHLHLPTATFTTATFTHGYIYHGYI